MATETRGFYVTQGTLRRDAPSYVTRRADEDFYDGLSRGEFCYVLTSRQMGKSSLMNHTAGRLKSAGVSVAKLDLTGLGQNLTAEQWYLGLLGIVGEELNLEEELEDFWDRHREIGPLQRWMRAIREVVMRHKQGRIVLFVDEIDTVRSLPFSTDEFFAGIREFYNRRTRNEDLSRLTFGLLGVATPSHLIRDTRTTPFNIGRRIELTDFTEAEALPLARGLGREERLARILLSRVQYWTGGHPYLTQRLCEAVAEDLTVVDTRGVDRVCEELFMSARARERDDNLLFVRERILRSEEADRATLLHLYQQVWKGKRVRDDETNTIVSVLRLSGITRSIEGFLHVRNRIYQGVFGREWVAANMPDAEVRRQRDAYRKGLWRAAAIAAVILTLMGIMAAAAIQQRNAAREQRRRADESAYQLSSALLKAEDQKREAERQRQIAEDKSKEADQQRRIAEDKNSEAVANAKRAEIALGAAEEQRMIAERNLQAAKAAKDQAVSEQKNAERNFKAALESESRFRKRSIDNNLQIVNLASRLKQISPISERPYWNSVIGNAQIQLRNYEDAIAYFSGTLNDEPNNISGLINRSYLYNVNGQPDKAVEDAKAALRINSNSAVASLNLALGLSLLGHYDDAMSRLEKGIQTLVPSGAGEYTQSYVSPEIKRATGRMIINADGEAALTAFYYQMANMKAAAGGDGFETVLGVADTRPRNPNAYLFALNWAWMNYDQRPQDFGALVAQASLWERAGYFDYALGKYREFQAQLKNHPDERRYDSLAQWVTFRIAKLQRSGSSIPSVSTHSDQLDANELYLLGRESLSSGKRDTLNFWTQAIEKDPNNVAYRIERAAFLYGRNDFVGTRLECDAILALEPKIAVAYLYRALANASKELSAPRTLIVEDIKRAKDLDPTTVPGSDIRNLDELTRILAENNVTDAIDLLERTSKYSYPSSTPYFLMARLLNQQHRYGEALKNLDQAIAIRPDNIELYDERFRAEKGLCTMQEKKDSPCANQIAIVRNQASGYKGFGDSLLRQGRTGEALDTYTKSVLLLGEIADSDTPSEVRRDIAVTLFTIAQVIRERGTRAKAIEYLNAEFGQNTNLTGYLDNEIKRLTNSP